MKNSQGFHLIFAQRGVALFTVLVFLIALTLLALASMRGSTLGERMARNSVDKSLATQAAEAALRDAEADILARNSSGVACATGAAPCRPDRPIVGSVSNGFVGDTGCSLGQCLPAPGSPFATPVWEDATKWGNAVVYGTYTGANNIPMVSQQPRYLIEGYQYDRGDGLVWSTFRISALGFGADANTQVLLQSIFVPVF